jgi:hypothetical protein
MDTIADDEIIYRCVFYGKDYYDIDSDSGLPKISGQAFADRNQKPSVDRAILRDNDPTRTQKTPKDGIVGLVVVDVRKIDTVEQMDSKGNLVKRYKIDVVSDPILGRDDEPDNCSHAEIRPAPDYETKNIFRKLQQRLAVLATERIKQEGWEIPPFDLRS